MRRMYYGWIVLVVAALAMVGTLPGRTQGLGLVTEPLLAPGVISSVYIAATAHAPKGAWPLGVAGVYAPDDMHLSQYAKAAKTREGFQRYLEEWVLTPRKSFSPA